MKVQSQTLHGWKKQYNAETRLYDYSPGESFQDWKSISTGPMWSDHVQPTDWHAVEHIYNGEGLPCLVDTTDKYHIAGNAILGYLGLSYAGAVGPRAEWLMDEAVARLAGNYDVLMNTRSWYDAARAIDGWADNFWSLYRNLRRNPRRAWGSFKRFAKHFFHRSISKAPEEIVRGLPATAREYCAIKYGALPIIHDLRDTLGRVQRPRSNIRVVATARRSVDPLLIKNTSLFKTWRITDSCSAIAVRYLSTDSVESYRNFGDLVQTPLYTVWDAIPWSFVIDWFLPVGNVLLQVQPFGFNVTRGFDCFRYRGYNVLQVSGSLANYGCNKAMVREFTRRVNTSMALGLNKAVSHYITNNDQLSYVRQVGHHLIDLYALGRSRLH
jgi:hypothetical protein